MELRTYGSHVADPSGGEWRLLTVYDVPVRGDSELLHGIVWHPAAALTGDVRVQSPLCNIS